jgi:hypothetical protein
VEHWDLQNTEIFSSKDVAAVLNQPFRAVLWLSAYLKRMMAMKDSISCFSAYVFKIYGNNFNVLFFSHANNLRISVSSALIFLKKI